MAETLIPELVWLPTSRYTLEEQLLKRKQRLVHMPTGYCVVALPHAVSFDAKVNFVNTPVVSDRALEQAHTRYFERQPDRFSRKKSVFDRINDTVEASAVIDIHEDEGSLEFT